MCMHLGMCRCVSVCVGGVDVCVWRRGVGSM